MFNFCAISIKKLALFAEDRLVVLSNDVFFGPYAFWHAGFFYAETLVSASYPPS